MNKIYFILQFRIDTKLKFRLNLLMSGGTCILKPAAFLLPPGIKVLIVFVIQFKFCRVFIFIHGSRISTKNKNLFRRLSVLKIIFCKNVFAFFEVSCFVNYIPEARCRVFKIQCDLCEWLF